MANSQIKDKNFNLDDNSKEKYTTLAMRETRLKKAKKNGEQTGDWSEFKRLGGENELKKLETIIHTAQNTNHSLKKTGMDAGRENQFIKKHEKDKDNANPTAIGGIPKMHKGNIKDKIMSNKEVYNEELNKEISEIKYLIEYMNNNKLKL